MARYPATYDVISRNRRNWPSLNFSQNAREEQTNNYWKRQVLMFYPLGKNSKNLKRKEKCSMKFFIEKKAILN